MRVSHILLTLLCIFHIASSSFTAVCLCLRSLNEPKSRKDTPFFRDFLPSLWRTTSVQDNVRIYVAIDDDDSYWIRRRWALDKAGAIVLVVNKTSLNGRIPFNEITAYAYDHGAEYLVRVNDDTIFLSPGWVKLGKNALENFYPPNLGVVAPFDPFRPYDWFEHDMTHRMHLQIFPFYYPTDIKNIYVDYWITLVYAPSHAFQVPNWTVQHKGVESRYKSTDVPFDYFAKSVVDGKKHSRDWIRRNYNQKNLFTNIVAYSLYGNNPRYCDGAIANAELMPKIFPGWLMRIYIHESVPTTVIDKLKTYKHVQVATQFLHDDRYNPNTWRFHVASDLLVSRYIVRDIDSRLSLREKIAVDEWIASKKPFHILHDHPTHIQPILSGLFGGTADAFPQMQAYIQNKKNRIVNKHNADQRFLERIVYPVVKDISLVHDAFRYNCGFDANPRQFPSPRIGLEFVGSVFIDKKIPQSDLESLAQATIPIPCLY